MTGQVFTKLHEALAVGRAQRLTEEVAALEAMEGLPHLVFDHAVAANLDKLAMVKSMVAMTQAGVLKLPYPRMLVEVWAGVSDERFFMLLEETAPCHYQSTAVQWDTDREERWATLFPICLCKYHWSHSPAPGAQLLAGDGRFIDSPADVDEGPGRELLNEWGTNVDFKWHDPKDRMKTLLRPGQEDKFTGQVISMLGYALMLALMVTNISGLERETVQPKPSFNRARVASGKPRIPDHTVVRIGHVYNSSGQKISYQSGGAGRKPMPVHMRAAHTRWQHHGPKWVEENPTLAQLPGNTEDGHRVLIDAVLVNYKDGTDLAKPLPKVVKL